MQFKLQVGKKTKWALIAFAMFVTGFGLYNTIFPLFIVIGMILLLISIVLELGLLFAALSSDFGWGKDTDSNKMDF